MAHLTKMERRLRRQTMERHQAEMAAKPSQPDATEQTEPKPVRKRVQRLLDTSAAELDQTELEILDELLETAREAVSYHRAEMRRRSEARQRGEPVPARWEVSPGVFDRISAKIVRILTIKVARRSVLKERSLVA